MARCLRAVPRQRSAPIRSAETDPFTANYTKQRDITLRQMIDAIGTRTVIDRVSGHNQYAAKACPSFNVPK